MSPVSLDPDDPSVEHHFTTVGDGIRYHYILAKPKEAPVSTVLLLHGWPDLAMGWRFQVPYLVSLGLQVIVPDLLGYGQTSAPSEAEHYSLRRMSDHMAHIVHEVTGGEPVILGGHDWGAWFAWRLALYWHPRLFRAVFCFSIPFIPPSPEVTTLEEQVAALPILRYQLQNASGEAEAIVGKSPERLRGYLSAMYGGATPEGLPGFDPAVGIIEERLERVGDTPWTTGKMMDFYVKEYARNGLHGPMNWYRTRELNGRDELPFAAGSDGQRRFQIPAMLVMAGQDAAFPPQMLDGQEQYFAAGLKKEAISESSHWMLVHCPEECNAYIGDFVHGVLGRK